MITVFKKKEKWVLAVAAVVTFILMLSSLSFERQMSNQKLMFYQLQAIRTSVNLYKAITRNNPSSLAELATSEYQFPGEEQKRPYLVDPTINGNGVVVDPFGNPYIYDTRTGWVRSSTKGYELW